MFIVFANARVPCMQIKCTLYKLSVLNSYIPFSFTLISQIGVKYTHACMPTQKATEVHNIYMHFHASESLFTLQIHLPGLCLVLMSYYHCMSRLGFGEVQRSPYRSLAQGRAAGHESASATLSFHRMEDQGLQLGGQGANVQLTCQPVSQRRRRRAG